MVFIKRSDVPVYLQSSVFFASLDENDQNEFEVPDDCFKIDDHIRSAADLHILLKTASFWGVDDVSIKVFPFMFHNTLDSTFLTELSATFPEHQRMLSNISLVKMAQPNSVILQAIYGHFSVSIVKYLYEHEGYILSSYACEAAVRMRDLHLMNYLHEQNCPWDCQTTEATIYSQNADILHFVCTNGCPLPEHAMFVAATASNVDAMIYLHNTMNVPYPLVLWLNLYNLPAIQHLRLVGCDWNISCCQEYAMYGKLECLIYAHENGCPWDADVCATAATYGHLPCLKYAHEEACPWSELTMINAAQFGNLDCLKYAREHHCPVNFLAPNQAFAYGQWRCLVYFIRQIQNQSSHVHHSRTVENEFLEPDATRSAVVANAGAVTRTRRGAYATGTPVVPDIIGSDSSASVVISSLHSSEMSDISYSAYSDDYYAYKKPTHSSENEMEEGKGSAEAQSSKDTSYILSTESGEQRISRADIRANCSYDEVSANPHSTDNDSSDHVNNVYESSGSSDW